MQRASNWGFDSVTCFVEEHPLDLSGSLNATTGGAYIDGSHYVTQQVLPIRTVVEVLFKKQSSME